MQGDTKNALISFAAMVPVVGAGATLAKTSSRLGRDVGTSLTGAATRRGPPLSAKVDSSSAGYASDFSRNRARDAEMDSFLASGATVRHSKTSTAIGNDPSTITNYERSIGADKLHDVIVHGTSDGRPVVNGQITHAQQIADAVADNPNYAAGCSIRLVMCHGGRETAAELSRILNVDVIATTRKAQLSPTTGRLLQGDF